MKHFPKLFILCSLCGLLLCACAGDISKTPASTPPAATAAPSPTPAPTAAPLPTEVPQPTAAPTPELPAVPEGWQAGFVQALGGIVSYEQGESGTSLKCALAACGLIDWAASPEAEPLLSRPDLLAPAAKDWFDALSPALQEAALWNWYDIRALCGTILSDPAAVEGQLSDAGIDPARYQGCSADLSAVFSVLDPLLAS